MKHLSNAFFIFLAMTCSNNVLAIDHVQITKDNIPYFYESHTPKASISSLLSIPDRPKDEFERKKRLPAIHKQLDKYRKIQNVKYSLALKLGQYDFEHNSFKFPITKGNSVQSTRLVDDDLRAEINPTYLGTDYHIGFDIDAFTFPMSEDAAGAYVKTHNRIIKVELFGSIKNAYQNESIKSVPNFFSSGSTLGYEIKKTLVILVNKVVIMDTNDVQLYVKPLAK